MNQALYIKELERGKRSFITWTLIIVATTVFIMAFFPSMQDMREQMEAMIEGFPEGMIKAFGMDPELFTSILGYYSTYYGMHIMMLLGSYAITLSGNILSKEEREGTADFLLTRPITRGQVVTSKLAAILTKLILLNVVQIVSAGVMMSIVSDTPIKWDVFTTISLYGVALSLFFLGAGLALSLVVKKGKSLTGPLIGLVIGGFVVKALASISESTEWLGWISPFKYADFDLSTGNYSLNPFYMLVLIGGAIVFCALAYMIYRKKDIFN